MKRSYALLLGLFGVTILSGCASNAIVNSGVTVSQRVYGRLGITGDNNNYTIERGSELERLSVIGDENVITVEMGARLSKLEIWGANNTIYLPKWLIVRRSIAGSGNQIVETPMGDAPAAEETSYQGNVQYRVVPQQQQSGYYAPPPQQQYNAQPRYSSPPNNYSTGTSGGSTQYYQSNTSSTTYSQPGVMEMQPVN